MITYKLLVTGPFSSGKTEFIKTISEIDVVSTGYRDNSMIALDFGRLTIDDSLVLYFFGAPGARRIDQAMWQLLDLMGFVVMVDSRRPETFREARFRAQETVAYGPLPYIFAANKQDCPDAWDVEALRIALKIDSKIPIVPCVATDRESVKQVLLTLLNEVLKDCLRPSDEEAE